MAKLSKQELYSMCSHQVCRAWKLPETQKWNSDHYILFSCSGRRKCRFGAGHEATPGKRDTPGYKLQDKPEIVPKGNGFEQLEVPCNNCRINACPEFALVSWRGNMDIQYLIYNTDPLNPDCQVIAKVCDYCVSYTCKGVKTTKEEINLNKCTVCRYTVTTDNQADQIRLVSQVLNKTTSSRLIPIQEVVVILLKLGMTTCTEQFDSISLNSCRVRTDDKVGYRNLVDMYAVRPSAYNNYSLYDFFHLKKNNTRKGDLVNVKKNVATRTDRQQKIVKVMHPVGAHTTPVYPPTPAYAQTMMKLYKPWRGRYHYDTANAVGRFQAFVKESTCPLPIKLSYEREADRFYNKRLNHEVTASEMETNEEEMSEEDCTTQQLASWHVDITNVQDSVGGWNFDYGLSYKWDKDPLQRDVRLQSMHLVSFAS